MSRRRWRIAAIACALPVAMLLAGCGKKAAEAAVVGQVIAHVGPDDVTQQELDNELRLANVPADARSDPILKAALSRSSSASIWCSRRLLRSSIANRPCISIFCAHASRSLPAPIVQRELSSKMSSVSKNETSMARPSPPQAVRPAGAVSGGPIPWPRRRISRLSRRRQRISKRLTKLKRS